MFDSKLNKLSEKVCEFKFENDADLANLFYNTTVLVSEDSKNNNVFICLFYEFTLSIKSLAYSGRQYEVNQKSIGGPNVLYLLNQLHLAR